jgi:histidinol-phosphate aminotransferase
VKPWTQSHGGEVWAYNTGLIDFSANINPLGPSKKALNSFKAGKVEHYPPPYSEVLRFRIAEYVGLNDENVTLCNGSIELVKDFCSLFLNKTDGALILEPTFSEYERFSKVYGKDSEHLLPELKYTHTGDEVISSVDENTRIIFICRPNNPTGFAMPEEGLRAILDFTASQDVYVFLDEVFIEFSLQKSLAPLVNEFRNLFVLRSFTKFFALPGLRIGYGIGSPEIIEKLNEIKPPWNINIFAHDAALASLKDKQYMQRTKAAVSKEKKFLTKKLSEIGLRIYPSDANFLLLRYHWNAGEVKKDLLKMGLLIRDCSNFYGLDTRFIRVSVRRREDNLLLIKALKKHLESVVERGRDCEYYPCHFEGQDCTFCFCPFYPCKDGERGRFITGKRGNLVWTCKDCVEIHKPVVVEKTLNLLGDCEVDLLGSEKLLTIMRKSMPDPSRER